MNVKILKIADAPNPKYANETDAGLDLYSAENILLKPFQRALIGTGVKMEIPDGYVGLIWDKSGMAGNYGIKTMAGVVDAGYRGEIKVVLINLSDIDFEIKTGAKIAQMLFQKVEHAHIEIVNELSDSNRGEGGFGSTGMD